MDLSVNSRAFLLLLAKLPPKKPLLFSFSFSRRVTSTSPLRWTALQSLAVTPLLSNIFLNHCSNSRLSWYLHLTNFSTSMCFIMPSLVKLCCRILKLATNQQSNFARQFTFPKGILPGQSTSISWQQAAPEPSCSILAKLVLRRSLSQPSSSPLDISMALLELMVTSFIISPVMLIRILTTTIIQLTTHHLNTHSYAIIRKAIVSQTIRSFLAGIDLLGVELEFLSLQDVSVGSAGLSGSGADAGEESLLGELLSDLGIDDSGLLALLNAGLGALGLLVLDLDVLGLLDVEVDTVVVDVPLGEGSGVDLDDAVLDEGVGTDQLVVGGVVDHVEDTGLAGGGLGGPVEVALLETQGAELVVSSSDSHAADSGLVGDELGVGDGTGLLESSLLLVDGHPATGQSALVPGVSVDSHQNMVKLISNKILINHLWGEPT